MPVVFFGHGSPTNAIEDNEATRAWYRIANSMERPEAILCISAHWYTHGSGNIVHNLALMDWLKAGATPFDWAARFNDMIKGHILDNNPQGIWEFQRLGQDAKLAVPSAEHLCPLLYTLGAREDSDTIRVETDFIFNKSLSMTSVVFDSSA